MEREVIILQKVINFFLTTAVVAIGFVGFDQVTKQYAKRRATSMVCFATKR